MKSHVSRLLAVATCIFRDVVAKCADSQLDLRDLITLQSRVEHEGLSFLTITLPTLGKELDLSLAEGRISSTRFRAFRKRGKAPVFLQGFFSLVFDEAGRILDEPSITAIEGIRQIAYTFKKLELPCTRKRTRAALRKFVDSELVFQEPLDPENVDYFIRVSRVIWPNIFGGYDAITDAKPKHGPGATAEKISGNAKFLMQRWHERLEPYFPLLDTAFVNADARDGKEFERVTLVAESEEQPVRVVTVPKTLKTPRIIAIEPVCMQYTQHALSGQIYDLVEGHELTRGHVNFRDQEVNRQLALSSSLTGDYATLDMSSASDLVPHQLALRMFDSNPDLRDAVDACRSRNAVMPDGTLVPLNKFAAMGSALCFPVEAMYFYTICVGALLKKRNLPVTYLSVRNVAKDVFVYGDDIIVPTDESAEVIDALQKYYCKVNVRKSFTTGNFRESCGMDAYSGYEVTPTYLRRMPPDNLRSTNALVSWVATSNLFHERGFWQTANYLIKQVEAITGNLPVVGDSCGGLGKTSPFLGEYSIGRWNDDLQVNEVKTWCASPVYRKDPLDGTQALLKCLLDLDNGSSELKSRDPKHLERTARHGAVTLKRRWMQPL